MARPNPGHRLREFVDGRMTASSSAPHSRLNQMEIQPPNHQRHSPLRNPLPTFDHPHPANGNTEDFDLYA